MAHTTQAPTDIERIRPWRLWFALGIIIMLAGLLLMTTVAATLFGIGVLAVGIIVSAAAYMTRHPKQHPRF